MDIKRKNEFIAYRVFKKFGYVLSPGQADIVRRIVFREDKNGKCCKRFSVSAMTQYGKTRCIAIAIALLLDNPNLKIKVAFIGPKDIQAGILREYLSELILDCPSLLKKARIAVSGEERITKEASRKRMTFVDGSEYRVFSAEGEANRLMGFGVGITDGIGIIVKDEACLIPRNANNKINRMMGNNPEDCVLIELYNPWDRDNVAFDHTMNPAFDQVRIGWKQAVAEGRTTKKFIDEQRKELTPLEFTVLYDSEFPLESEDSLFNLGKIRKAEETNFDFDKELERIENKLKESHKHKEGEINKAKLELKRFTKIISCDPADKGLDETVIFWGVQKETKFKIIGNYSEPKTESMDLVGRIIDLAINFIGRKVKGIIKIDRIGIGAGPLSRIKELIRQKGYSNITVIGCHFGETAVKKDHYRIKKAENYFRLQAIFNEELISIPKLEKLKKQLIGMKWGLTSSSKREVFDPGVKEKKEKKSPDWSDALVYFVWKDSSGLIFSFG